MDNYQEREVLRMNAVSPESILEQDAMIIRKKGFGFGDFFLILLFFLVVSLLVFYAFSGHSRNEIIFVCGYLLLIIVFLVYLIIDSFRRITDRESMIAISSKGLYVRDKSLDVSNTFLWSDLSNFKMEIVYFTKRDGSYWTLNILDDNHNYMVFDMQEYGVDVIEMKRYIDMFCDVKFRQGSSKILWGKYERANSGIYK